MSARVGTSDGLRTTYNDAYSRRFWRASKPETHNDALPRQAAHCYNKNYRDFLHRVVFYVDSNFLEKHNAYNFRVEGSGVTICWGYRPIATIMGNFVTKNYGNGKGVCPSRRQKVPVNHVSLLTRLNFIRTLNITIKSVTAMKSSDLTIRTFYESNRCFMRVSLCNSLYISSLRFVQLFPSHGNIFLKLVPLCNYTLQPATV